ncbi:MAG: hypothetical protein C4326_07895 [Ignavibacteria bacterium]
MACGRRSSLRQRNRRDVPLTGYEGSHFFPYKTPGADYCEVCAFAVLSRANAIPQFRGLQGQMIPQF